MWEVVNLYCIGYNKNESFMVNGIVSSEKNVIYQNPI